MPLIIHVPANAPIKRRISKAGKAELILFNTPSNKWFHEIPFIIEITAATDAAIKRAI